MSIGRIPAKYLLPLVVTAILTGAVPSTADNSSQARTASGKTEMEGDLERIQGMWVITDIEIDGESSTGYLTFLIGVTQTYKRNAIRNSYKPDQECTFILKPEPKPARVVFVTKDSQYTNLYEFRGDNLRYCSSVGVGGRQPQEPTEFNSKNGQIILTLKREKNQEK